jgi:hypothetical protein
MGRDVCRTISEPKTKEVEMLLRDHPLVSNGSVSSWPPAWTWVAGSDNQHPKGEIGILKAVAKSNVEPVNRCYLYIDYNGASYVGCVSCDHVFCAHLVEVLKANRNRPIAEIGGLDLSHMV